MTLVLALLPICAFPINAQSTTCTTPSLWDQCALSAAGYDAPPRGVTRQIVMVDKGGPPHFPYRGIMLRESTAGVEGSRFALWPLKAVDSPLAEAECGERFANDGGMLCVLERPDSIDWRALLASLDSAGLGSMPVRPLVPPRCDPPETTRTGTGDYICSIMADGPYLEVSTSHHRAHWQYTITLEGDRSSGEYLRDQEVMRMFGRVLRGR
ncbi:MAG TPA: hypothetical protein PLL69_01630 [Gemmatimonadales bacterium]|nr:hypothetical protein [Gemmatimonadales bacterium]